MADPLAATSVPQLPPLTKTTPHGARDYASIKQTRFAWSPWKNKVQPSGEAQSAQTLPATGSAGSTDELLNSQQDTPTEFRDRRRSPDRPRTALSACHRPAVVPEGTHSMPGAAEQLLLPIDSGPMPPSPYADLDARFYRSGTAILARYNDQGPHNMQKYDPSACFACCCCPHVQLMKHSTSTARNPFVHAVKLSTTWNAAFIQGPRKLCSKARRWALQLHR